MPPAARSDQLLDRLWGTDRPPSRLGRPAGLDLRRILDVAVTLADTGGLAAVTLPKIAGELGVTGMSLYRHVGSKDELLVLMTDAGLGPPPDLGTPADLGLPRDPGLPRDLGPASVGWREGLRRWAHAEHAVYRRRPWLARVAISGPPSDPNQLAWMEAALAALRDTGLGWDAKVRVLTLISGSASVTCRCGAMRSESPRTKAKQSAAVSVASTSAADTPGNRTPSRCGPRRSAGSGSSPISVAAAAIVAVIPARVAATRGTRH
jgi:AcrR family transcriptional regulator